MGGVKKIFTRHLMLEVDTLPEYRLIYFLITTESFSERFNYKFLASLSDLVLQSFSFTSYRCESEFETCRFHDLLLTANQAKKD